MCTGVIDKEKGVISCNGINQDDNLEKYLENILKSSVINVLVHVVVMLIISLLILKKKNADK